MIRSLILGAPSFLMFDSMTYSTFDSLIKILRLYQVIDPKSILISPFKPSTLPCYSSFVKSQLSPTILAHKNLHEIHLKYPKS